MSTQNVTLESMQEDHERWVAGHATWRKDIERWQADHEAAIARLADLQALVRTHGEALEQRSQAFRKAEAAIAAHEREIADYRVGNSERPQDVVANRHRDQEGVFSQQQDAHERIRKHHKEVMSRLKALESAAGAAM